MIHLSKQIAKELVKIVFTDKKASSTLTDYQPELFERSTQEEINYVNQRYSEYEALHLQLKYQKYKKNKTF